MPSVGYLIAVGASLQEDVEESGYTSGTLLVGFVGLGIALGIGVGMALNSHFVKKQRFLSMIVPDPSTLI